MTDDNPASPEKRLREAVKQTEIVLDELEGDQPADRAPAVEELEEGVRYLLEENIRGRYRDNLLGPYHGLATALRDGDDPIPAFWLWHWKLQEVTDMIAWDLSKAGFFDRESPAYQIAFSAFSLAHYAVGAAGGPAFDTARPGDVDPENRLARAMQTYREIGEYLGRIRVDVLGEVLEDAPSQEYDPIELTPTYGKYDGGNGGVLNEDGALESGHFQGQIMQDDIHLHFLADGESDEWGLSFTASPETCRELALRLFEVAGDAENSSEVKK